MDPLPSDALLNASVLLTVAAGQQRFPVARPARALPYQKRSAKAPVSPIKSKAQKPPFRNACTKEAKPDQHRSPTPLPVTPADLLVHLHPLTRRDALLALVQRHPLRAGLDVARPADGGLAPRLARLVDFERGERVDRGGRVVVPN